MLNSLIILLFAYFLSKLGYMVLFNNFFHLLTLKRKMKEESWVDKFSKILGYTLLVSGLVTGLLILVKKYFPETYLYFYLAYIIVALAFLAYKYFALKKADDQGLL